MQWWCSATGELWTWEWRPYLGAWLLFGVALAAFLFAWRHDRHEHPLRRPVCGVLGLVVILAATEWPLAALGAGYLVWFQAIRQVLVVLVAVPLLLYGAPPVIGRWLEGSERRRAAVRTMTNPVLAVITANVILILLMSPLVADRLVPTPLGSFAADIGWIVGGVILWLPVQPPLPMRARIEGPPAMVYLIVQSVVPLPVAFFMTWSDYPLYAVYELAPRIFTGIDPVDDQELGAATLQVIGGLVIWSQIAVRFLGWAVRRHREENQLTTPAPVPV
jgi:cytochrome c oxidase assembly factor CtaG